MDQTADTSNDPSELQKGNRCCTSVPELREHRLISIGIFVTSILFLNESYELNAEYKNVSEICRGNRVTYCGKCPPATENHGQGSYSFGGLLGPGGCRYGRDLCYQEHAEDQAAQLDYNELLVRSSSNYFGKYRHTYNFHVTGSGKKYIEEKELKLRSYPESRAALTVVALCFAPFQTLGLIALGMVAKFRKVDMEKLWIGIFVACFQLLLAMFITAMVSKANYTCPGLQYMSKYGDGECTNVAKTCGRSICGFLGANMFLYFFISSYLIYLFVKKGEYRNSETEMIKQ